MSSAVSVPCRQSERRCVLSLCAAVRLERQSASLRRRVEAVECASYYGDATLRSRVSEFLPEFDSSTVSYLGGGNNINSNNVDSDSNSNSHNNNSFSKTANCSMHIPIDSTQRKLPCKRQAGKQEKERRTQQQVVSVTSAAAPSIHASIHPSVGPEAFQLQIPTLILYELASAVF